MRFSDWLIPLRQPTHRGRNQHRRPRVAALLEMLEDRVMLSGVTGVDYQEVDADWFATLGQKTTSSASAGPAGAYGHGQGNPTSDHDNSQWIVRLTSDAVELAPGVHTVQCVLDTGDYPLKVLGGLGLPGQVLVDSGDAPTDQVRELLADHPLVSSFEANLGVRGQETFPDDPRFSEEVGLHNTGQSNGLADADIDAPEAWDITTGSSDVVVAVVDSGVDYLHPDLQNNIWINTGEIAGNGIDDDGNGFVDDIQGYDFQANDADPMDEHRHGTHVAGVVAGDGNNSLGISGVTWSSTIMPLRFLDSNNSGLTSDAVRAINYATMMRTDHGVNVRVINNSWGSEGERSNSTALHDAIQAAGNSGILVTAAAGNGNAMGFGLDLETLPFYPASYDLDNVVGVAATGQFDELARFSNFSNQDIDLAAPGVGILSTFPRNQGEYSQLSGTSFATPQVSGTAALIWSELPDATVAEVRAALLQGVDSISALDDKVVTGGRLNAHGSLTIDTYATRATLTAVDDVTTKDITTHDMTIDYADNVAIDVSSIDDSDIIVRRQDGTGSPVAATRVSVAPDGNGTDRTAVYRIVPPGGSWDSGENGDWEIVLLNGRVLDTAGNASPEQVLGGFNVTLPLSGPFQVNSFNDTVDADPGNGLAEDADGNITLRSAIIESNALAGLDTIQLEAGTYTLSLAGAGEDAAATGDLDITGSLDIIGRGINTTTIDANDLDRVLHIPDDANIVVRLTDLTLTNGAVTGDGGGILNGGQLELTRVKIASSTSTGSGGAIHNSNVAITVTGSHLADNQATVGGGAIYTTRKATIIDSTISGNTAGTAGGGLLASSGNHTITGVTFSGNQAGTDGGAFYSATGFPILKHVTMVQNTAADSGGGVRINNGMAQLMNSLIAQNTSTNDHDDVDVSGAFDSAANNLVGDPGTVTGVFDNDNGDLFGSAASPLDPKLGSLSDNGGTAPTHYPAIDSPVVDAGHNDYSVNFDQRGISRPEDGDDNGDATTDIGAVEFLLYTEIHGTKYHDHNSNGIQDAGEEPLSDWTIFLDTDDDGDLDSGEISTTTDVDGNYSFVDLLPGDYIVREVIEDGWEQISPEPRITDYLIDPTVYVDNAAVVETDSGTTNLVFDVTLTHPLLQTVTVDYTTADGTADGSDYQAASGTLTFAPGETSGSIIVAITGDTDNEPHETLVVDLSNPGNATLGDAQATGTIYDNDAGFVVNSTADAVDANPGDGLAQDDQGRTTLRAAIMEANALAGDDDIFIPAGTYTLSIDGSGEDLSATGDLDVTDTSGQLRITGAGTELVTIDANNIDRVFDILANTDTHVAFLAITNGFVFGNNDGAGVKIKNSNSSFTNLDIHHNASGDKGGGIHIGGSSVLEITRSTIADNSASGSNRTGGGISLDKEGATSKPSVIVTHSTIENNSGTSGAGFGIQDGDLVIHRSQVIGNSANYGGGIFTFGGVTAISNSDFSQNTAGTGCGGSIYAAGEDSGATLSIDATSMTGNSARFAGGAICGYVPTTINRSTFSNNRTTQLNSGSHFQGGGAIEFDLNAASEIAISHTTIIGNISLEHGGGISQTGNETIILDNTIVANNTASSTGNDLSGTFTTGGHNLIGDNGGHSGFTNGTHSDLVGTTANPLDPMLGPLADNGGSGPTHRPLAISPAIDSGDPLVRDRTDQRGVSGISNAGGVDKFLSEDPRYEHTISTTANEAFSVFSADVDGDGDMDVLSASSSDDKIAWYENDGDETFTAHSITTTADGARSVFAADVDGDGDMDVLSASQSDNKIAWYENNGDSDGDETFTAHSITTTADGARSVFAADVDGDGDMDVLSASQSDNKIAWYENDGSEAFTAHTITSTAEGAASVFAADVDGDGDIDVLSASMLDDKIAWYENDGSESFTPHNITTEANGAVSVFAADVDSDGDLDVLSASSLGDTIAWYENNGSEAFTPHNITTEAYVAYSVFTADVDGDGDIDVLSATMDNKIAWYENDGSEAFTPHNITTEAYGAASVFAADVDGDGDIDVLSASLSDDKIAWYENDGNATFALPHTITTSADSAESVYAIDLDDDGDIDVLSASDADDKIAWYENDGNRNFTSHTITTSADGARSVYAIDVDGDGDMDVVSASLRDHKIAWYENDGNENFTSHTITTSDSDYVCVYAIDVDGDGDVDVLSASKNDNKVAWYENDGSESFTPHNITTEANSARGVYAIDVDDDGDVDVLSASANDGTVALYENDGNQSFTRHVITETAGGVHSVFAADIDADGDMDVLSANWAYDQIAWYENNGNESFTTHLITTTADGAWTVFAADVDTDGDMDVLSASRTDDKIAWYENDGDENFTSHTITTSADLANSVYAIDVDGDGDMDVLSASANDDKIAWYENTAMADIGAVEQEFIPALGGSHTLTLTPGQVVSGVGFGDLALPGTISGTKFHDVNENGVHDSGENGLSGWTIYLDQNSNGTLDPDEETTITDSGGNYQFTALPPLVDYTVREILQSGWLQTAPVSTSHVISLNAEGSVVDKDFGNTLIPGEIHGSVFRDDDSDGIWDTGEPALEDWEVFLDDDDDGRWDSGETKTVTDEVGLYSFTDLDPLVTYHVGETRPFGIQLTAPQPATGDATVGVEPFATDTRLQTAWDIARTSDGSFYVTGLDGIGSGFNAQAIFHVSADGSNVDIQTPANQPRGVTGGENYLYYVDTALSGSGMGIYRRPLEGGVREQILDGQAASPPITSARDVEFVTVGESSLLIVNDDHAGRVFKVTLGGTSPVVEQLGPDRYTDSADRRHASHIVVEGDTVYLADTGVDGFGDTPVRVLSIGLDDDDFTELFSGSTDDYSLRGIAVGDETIFLADEDEILQLPVTGGTPTQLVGHPRFGDLQGIVFHNGTLHVLDNTDASQSVTWKVSRNSAVTAVAHGIHNNWDVALAPAAVITGRNFGIHDPDAVSGVNDDGEITGHWFNDIDADGVQDTGEPGLPNRTVYLDLNNNGMLEAGEPSTVSLQDDVNTPDNEDGYYSFASLVAGDYTISAADESDGWTQTLPLETGYAAHTLSAADGPAGVGTIDANDDGHLDLVATNRDTNTVSIFTATGDGDYLDPVEYEVGVGPAAVVTGDMDDDGIDDLVVANLYTSNVSVLRGDGNGGFHDAVNTSVGSGPFDLLVVDLDGDGDLDVATANEFSNNVSVLLNDGDSTLGDLDHTGVGNSAESVIAGDWDQDGDVDLAAAVFESNEVVILENNGSAAFSEGDRHTVGTGPFSLDAADFDNDGDIDLVSANLLSNDVTVLLNGAASGFQPQLPLATGYGPMAIASTDMDNDGDVDIAVANATSTNVSIMLNNGSGLFAAARSYGVGDFPNLLAFSLAVTDLDGDGTHDIVLANGRDDSLAVLRNEEVPGSHRMALADSQTAEGVDFGVYQDYSAHFDDDNGLLLIGANQPRNIVVDVVDGNVRIMVNGQLDDALGIVDPSDVQELRISGSAAADLIDLSGVTAADFDHASGLTTRIETGDGDDTIIGSGLPDTILSGNGDDTIDGGDGNDKLNGGGGNDTATGGAGQDTVDGGGGEDVLSGGDGNDRVRGQGSEDTLTGGAGDDTIEGGPAYDQLRETADVDFTITDTSLSGVGTDVLLDLEETYLTGGSSANTFDGTAFDGRVIVNAKGGNDTMLGGVRADRLLGGSGRDLVRGGVGNDVVRGQGGNNDTVLGEEGDDRLDGGVGHDILDGGPGNDKLTGGTGNDTIDGGEGTDKVQEFGDFNMTLTDSLLTTGGAGTDTIQNVETAYLKAGNGDNKLTTSGFAGHVTLVGLNGDDTLTSGSGNDNLAGRAGDDVMNSGDGNDTVLGHRGADSVNGGGGNDSLVTHDGNDTIDAGTGNDTVFGGDDDDSITSADGSNMLSGGNGNDVVTGGLGADVLLGGSGNDNLSGGAGNDDLEAGDGTDTLQGQAGNDSLDGGGGDDELLGGDDDDLLETGGGADTVDGGTGDDLLVHADSGDITVTDNSLVGTVSLVLADLENIDLAGDELANFLDARGYTGTATLRGGDGDDTLASGPGDDRLLGEGGNDILAGFAGNDVFNGGSGDDSMLGGDGNDTLSGANGDDAVVGQGGDDSVKGQGGTDTLAGGSGGGAKDSGDVLSDATAGEIDEAFSLDFDDLIGQTN